MGLSTTCFFPELWPLCCWSWGQLGPFLYKPGGKINWNMSLQLGRAAVVSALLAWLKRGKNTIQSLKTADRMKKQVLLEPCFFFCLSNLIKIGRALRCLELSYGGPFQPVLTYGTQEGQTPTVLQKNLSWTFTDVKPEWDSSFFFHCKPGTWCGFLVLFLSKAHGSTQGLPWCTAPHLPTPPALPLSQFLPPHCPYMCTSSLRAAPCSGSSLQAFLLELEGARDVSLVRD